MRSDEVLKFWFEDLNQKDWFAKNPELDEKIRLHFGNIHRQAAMGELDGWRGSAHGRLAEILILDQFSRNIYRDDARAFAWDGMALVLAQEIVHLRLDGELDVSEKAFAYMPFMHSESRAIHEKAVQLFSQPGLEFNLRFEIRHKEIIDRFGRYPHRNASLGRKSTNEEIAFLNTPGSAF